MTICAWIDPTSRAEPGRPPRPGGNRSPVRATEAAAMATCPAAGAPPLKRAPHPELAVEMSETATLSANGDLHDELALRT